MQEVRRIMARWFAPVAVLCSVTTHADAQAPVADAYSALVQWSQPSGWEVTPIHIGLLPNGNIFFVNEYNYPQHPGKDLTPAAFNPEFMFLMTPTPAGTPLPSSVLIEPRNNLPALTKVLNASANNIQLKSLVCSGHALTADGLLMFAGGAHSSVDLAMYNSGDILDALTVVGISESIAYNPTLDAWIANPGTVVAGPATHQPLRWYPTVTRLADTRMLVMGGYEKVYPHLAYNTSAEVFDPRNSTWTPISDYRTTPPGIENPDYTHVFQDPADDRILVLGGSGEPLILNLAAQTPWQSTGNFRPGAKAYINGSTSPVFPNYSSSSSMLPIRLPGDGWGYANGSIINVGGDPDSQLGAQVDVYDPSANSWRPSMAMHSERHHPSTVILPDGRILIIAGWNNEMTPVKQTGYAEYVDPKNNFAISQGIAYMPETRGYHTLTLLLPDGRILLGGGNPDGNDGIERSDFRYYYPDYIFKTRPQITAAPDAIAFGASASVTVPHGTSVAEADLLALGSMTHSFDLNQRLVEIRVTGPVSTSQLVLGAFVQVTASQCTASASPCYDTYSIQAPETADTAPPGYYTLYLLDANRVPSEGRILKLGPRQPDCAVYSRTATSGLYAEPLVVSPGRTVTFEAHCNYGTSDPPPTFSWSGGATTFNTTVTAPSAAGANAMYSVSVTQFGQTLSYSASVSTAPDGAPACAITQQPASPTAFTPVTLNANCPGASLLKWTTGTASPADVRGSNTAIATVFNVVNPSSPLSAGVDLVVSNGSGTGALVESNLFFRPAPPSCSIAASPAGTVAPGTSVTLTAQCDGQPTSFAWSTGATASTITVTPAATTEYTVAANSDAGALPAVHYAVPVSASVPAMPNLTGHWWGGASENGWGATLNQHGSIAFGVVYFYDPSGRPTWAVMPSGSWDATNTVYTGDLYVPSGSPYTSYDPSKFVANAAMGTAQFTFVDSKTLYISATMGYAPATSAGRHTTFFQKKLTPLIVNEGAAPNGVNYGDMWWGGNSQNGWGIAIDQSASTLFAAWFTYASDRRPTWFIFQGNTWNGSAVTGSIFRTSGTPMLGTVYNASSATVSTAGSGTMSFSAPAQGTFNYTIDGVAGSQAIVKQPY